MTQYNENETFLLIQINFTKNELEDSLVFFDVSLIPSFVPKLEYFPPSVSRRNTPFSVGRCKQFFDVLTDGCNVWARKKESKKMLTYDFGCTRKEV